MTYSHKANYRLAYADPAVPSDFAALAAGYTVGLAKNHPFVDGNKRAALLATGLFLYLNGYRLNASQVEATVTLFAVAAGDAAEDEFAAWLRTHAAPRPAPGSGNGLPARLEQPLALH
ncbi:MAG: type II toxin-antitoxin system death-on-curing family toxin [Polaromonas sp.]